MRDIIEQKRNVIMRKIFFSLLIILLIQLHAFSANSNNAMSNALDSWKGYTVDDVIAVWGYPESEKNIAGKKLYIWEERNFSVLGNQYSIQGVEDYCVRILETDENNKVVSWEWKGNACPILRCTTEKWVNPNNNPWKKEKMNKKKFRIF